MKQSPKKVYDYTELPQVRVNLGLTQSQVAASMHTVQPVVWRIENQIAQGSLPKLEKLRQYANALGFDLKIRCVKKNNSKTDPTPSKNDSGEDCK